MSTLLLGAVAYDPKVVTIWDGFRALLRDRGLDIDYQLFSNYERQVENLIAGTIDLAWNSPLAWVRSRRLAESRGLSVRSVLMRDTDRDLRSVVVVRSDSDLATAGHLHGRRIAVGAIDSPQATLLPLSALRALGVRPGADFELVRHDIGVGLHGDHIGGERAAAQALRDGRVDAACLTDTNLLLFGQEGLLRAGSVRVVAHTPSYDHCTMTTAPLADRASVDACVDALRQLSYADPAARQLLDLEGLKRWLPGRVSGFQPLEIAVDEAGFYDRDGGISAGDYRP